MNFTKQDRDNVLRAIASATTTLCIFSESDETEDGTTQMIRKKLREYAGRLFDLEDEIKKYFENFKTEFE